jgi:hypothetical protein
LIPWSTFWDRNYFAEAIPGIRVILMNNFARGAVSGLGIVNVIAALVELGDMIGARTRASALPEEPGTLGDRHAP